MAALGGMSQIAQKGIEAFARDVGNSLHEIKLALAQPPYRPNAWQKYNDGYYRTFQNGRWWILINGKVYPN